MEAGSAIYQAIYMKVLTCSTVKPAKDVLSQNDVGSLPISLGILSDFRRFLNNYFLFSD